MLLFNLFIILDWVGKFAKAIQMKLPAENTMQELVRTSSHLAIPLR